MEINFFHFPPAVLPLARKAAIRAAAHRKKNSGEVNIILIADPEIKKLNRKYRSVNRITDVISFLNSESPFQGDIYIARRRSQKQARRIGHEWGRELAYLTIHGILHLYGYTDYTPREKKKMFSVQDKVFERLS